MEMLGGIKRMGDGRWKEENILNIRLLYSCFFATFTGSQPTDNQTNDRKRKAKFRRKTVRRPFVYQDRAGASLLPRTGTRHSPAKPLPMDAKMRPTPDRTATIRLRQAPAQLLET